MSPTGAYFQTGWSKKAGEIYAKLYCKSFLTIFTDHFKAGNSNNGMKLDKKQKLKAYFTQVT